MTRILSRAEVFQMRLGFFMDRAEQPEFRIRQVQSMPRFEQMMNAFALDQRAGKDRAKDWRARSRLEPIGVDPTGEVKKLFFGKIFGAERLGRLLRKYDHEVGQIVFFQETFTLQQKAGFPRGGTARCAHLALADLPGGAIPVPRWDLDQAGNAFRFCHTQGLKAVARPAVKEIVAAGLQFPRSDPVEILLLRSIIVGALNEGDQADRVPP